MPIIVIQFMNKMWRWPIRPWMEFVFSYVKSHHVSYILLSHKNNRHRQCKNHHNKKNKRYQPCEQETELEQSLLTSAWFELGPSGTTSISHSSPCTRCSLHEPLPDACNCAARKAIACSSRGWIEQVIWKMHYSTIRKILTFSPSHF